MMVDFIADAGNESLLTKIRAIILSVGCDTNKLSQSYREKSFPVNVNSKVRSFETPVITK